MPRSLIKSLALFILFTAALAFVQFSTPDLPDNDGYYHIKLAYIMRTEGLKPHFPWLPLTILNEREFYDHHFLFHVALIPFTFGDLRLGAKWAAVFFAGLAFIAVWYLFHRQKVPYAGLWALGLLAVSEAFLYRMSITRAQSLSLGVLALGMAWMLEGKKLPLVMLSFLYVWMYDAFPLLPALAGLCFAATWLAERRLEWRPLSYVILGTLLGMAINPYFPFNLVFAYRHFLPKLVEPTAVRVGNEWYPYDTSQILVNSGYSLLAFVSGIFALGLRGERFDRRTVFGLLAALLFGFMLFKARRFIEYFPPFSLVFAAFAWAPLLQKNVLVFPSLMELKTRMQTWKLNRSWLPAFLPFAALFLVIWFGSMSTLGVARGSIQRAKPFDLYAGAAAWLQANTPAGARVFQTDWDDFPRLYFYDTHNTYLVGLDPTYMQLYSAELYDLWVRITRGEIENPSRYIAGLFASAFVHSDLGHKEFLRLAAQDPGLKEVYRDHQAVIFEVIP